MDFFFLKRKNTSVELLLPAKKFFKFLLRDKLSEIGDKKCRARSVSSATGSRRSRGRASSTCHRRSARSRSHVMMVMVMMRCRSSHQLRHVIQLHRSLCASFKIHNTTFNQMFDTLDSIPITIATKQCVAWVKRQQ